MNQIDRVARDDYASEENQSWFIDKRHDRIHVRVYERTKRIWLKAIAVTHNRDCVGIESLEIEARTLSQRAIMRSNSIEIDGVLLQGELLEMVTIGDDCHIRFSVNPLQCQKMVRSPDEVDISFHTSPRTARLAYWKRINQMIEQGQIEIPRTGYFDQYLTGYPDRSERARLEIPYQCQLTEPSGDSFQVLEGRFEVARDAVLLPRINATNAIGDTTCQYNARSRMIRCAVNPCGPCEGCQHYEKI
jgi:hypothetical protein